VPPVHEWLANVPLCRCAANNCQALLGNFSQYLQILMKIWLYKAKNQHNLIRSRIKHLTIKNSFVRVKKGLVLIAHDVVSQQRLKGARRFVRDTDDCTTTKTVRLAF
jgi:hypothetical protein